jgi:hypothetical protein
MIDDIYKRAKVLSKACLKIAVVLPQDQIMAVMMRAHLIDCASKMTIKARGLMAGQVQDMFLRNVMDAKEAADGCHFWLELIKDENLLDSQIIDPILAESQEMGKMFAFAMKKAKPNTF